ncbi:uncharacterized protein LOC117809023 [Xyrichtys novacula]|uniref:Uncharacterized protein LOC117809023 n=1 Tax=Xyrichtys novacula TaxID=13765 RepID=A0AAV1GJ56_XYRNO|nr:uncharacterized protein LOC117809023 [Xyrichtys novacula]
MDPGSSKTMEVAALGRPFSLGMLYDCRQDSLIPGITLWDCEDLGKSTRQRPSPNSEFDIVASESIEDKSSALNVEASLRASFLSGLVQVGGSAKYLNDKKTSKNQARVTLKYKTTTKFQELSMDHLGAGKVRHPDVFEKGLATHVVTGILYGAQAFFIFDREVCSEEDHHDVEGNLKVIIEKIPALAVKGKGALELEEKDISNVEKFSCKFHGDFSLKQNPASFQEAVQVCKSLPELLGADGENAVPVKIWLLPLTAIDSSAARLVCQISIRLVQESQSVLEDLSELEMRCNDVLRTTPAQQFPQISKNIKTFKEMSSVFRLEFQQSLAKTLPSIRGGGEEEAVLAEILKRGRSSPFNSERLNEWMDCKEKEIYTLMSVTDTMKNLIIVKSENHLYKEIQKAKHAVCFVFTSLGSDEPFLLDLTNYLRKNPEPETSQDPRILEKEQWYASREIVNSMRAKAKLFSDFAAANQENKNIKFLIAAIANETQRGSSIYLYEGGFTVSENFELPSKPEDVTLSNTNHNSVTLKIDPPKSGAENITSYSVEYCVRGEEGWKQQTATKAGEVTVGNLSPNTEYMFRCRAVTSVGVGPANEVSDPIKTSPEKPEVRPNQSKISTSLNSTPEPSTTKLSLTDTLKKKSKKISSASPSVYQLPLKKERMNINGCRGFSFGKESMKENRTVMLLGATGSGKSTLINGMINYILGVNWNDSLRFKIIDEVQTRSQAESQTSEVTVYKIYHQDGFMIDYSLTLIDTPGFGDTRGIKRDREIVDQLRNLFSSERGVREIDAVGFVVQAALARLTTSQKYIFDSVLSIFGKDIEENIRILVTFSDGQPPPLLEAIKAADVPCPKTKEGQLNHCKFNNSAWFADNKSPTADMGEGGEAESFGKMFWNMGAMSMKRFFTAVNLMDTKSLTLTKEVLTERQQLETSVEGLQKQVKVGLAKLEEIKETTEKLKEHEAEINRNKDFTFEVNIIKPFQIHQTGGGYLFNCQQCDFTCHDNCFCTADKDKIKCSAVGPDGYCRVCPGKCIWSVHFNQKYKWEYRNVTETKTVEELKKKYDIAKVAKSPLEALIKKLNAEYDEVQAEVQRLMDESTRCINRLKEIALRPNPLFSPEYIDMLIEGEKSEAKPGWMTRVQTLMEMKGKAQIIARVEGGETLLQRNTEQTKQTTDKKTSLGLKIWNYVTGK